MKRVIASRLQGRTPEEIEDVTEEACVSLFRANQRGGIKNLEALQVTIAERRSADFLKRISRSVRLEPLEDEGRGIPAPRIEDDDELSPEEAQFYVREIMKLVGEKCRKLFDYWMETLNLRIVAERLGISHDTARQRKVRCEEKVRKIAVADGGPLGRWARSLLEPA